MSKEIVFIGDSLTQWFDWQKRFPNYKVANLGVAGEQVEGLLGRRDHIRSRIKDPDYIFIMSGINNIGMGEHDITRSYREVLQNFTSWYKKSRVVVQSILPVTMDGISNTVIKDANRHLARIAREYNAEYLDIYSFFVDAKGNPKSEYLQDDGLHLSNKGYEVWAKAVEKFLSK